MTNSLNTPGVDVVLTCVYGSRLYGTSTPTSDTDVKAVYLPKLEDVLLGKKHPTFKLRFDAEGNKLGTNAVMPPDGIETEYVPFVTFCRDYLEGQTYALEVAQACVVREDPPAWLEELVTRFTTCNIYAMASFARKQTFDYVHRGERLEKARTLLEQLQHTSTALEELGYHNPRLDTYVHHQVVEGKKVLHALRDACALELGTTVNNGRMMETLKLNGRDYLETTTLEHLHTAVQKLVDSYGHRTQAAAEAEVDRKSLMHAVRVYDQALELLRTGKMVFPRPEAALLLRVKNELPHEVVKKMLLNLEAQLEVEMANTKMQAKTPEMEAAFEEWLLDELRWQYSLRPYS